MSDPQPTETGLAELAERFWELQLEAGPTTATLLGDHRFDDRLPPVTTDEVASIVDRLETLRHEVESLDPAALTDTDRLTHRLLAAEIDDALVLHRTDLLLAPLDPLIGVHSTLHRAVAQASLPEPTHAEAVLDRYRQVPRFLQRALGEHRRQAEAGRAPTESNVAKVIAQLDAYLGSPVDTDPFLAATLPEGWSGAEGWRETVRRMISDVLRPAFADYRDGIETDIAPHARSDERPGLAHVPGGEGLYGDLMAVFTSLRVGPDELHRIGTEEATTRLPDEYREPGEAALGTGELTEILTRLRSDPDLTYRDASEILADAEAAVQRATEAAGDWFRRLPEAPCVVQPIPAELAPSQPPAYYLPPAADGSRPGVYFVNTHAPETRSRHDAEAVAYHEAVPGHHFQVALAAELPGLPEFRRHATHTAYTEGWGLYAERLADEMGLYSSPLSRIGMLSAESWRACRLVVDTGLHHLGWSRQQAIDFVLEWSAVAPETAAQEVDRYIGIPGQALAYKVGQRELLRLRGQAEERLGSRFDPAGFHDVVLGQGAMPLPVLTERVEAWIADGGEGGI